MIAAKKPVKPTAPALIPACAYVRMSTDDQKESPDQQRAEVAKLAKLHGCRIVCEYFDSGISGAETKKRKQFVKMMGDAARGEFKVILCWDQDRFGRFDSVEGGHWHYLLRESGVTLITVAQGKIDTESFTGRTINNITQDGKHQFLVDLSRNSLRGIIAKAKAGKPHGMPPFGYDRAVYNEQGQFMQRVPYGERFVKPKSWASKFVPTEDKKVLAVIREIFDRYDRTAITIRAMAMDLNRRGIPSANGGNWSSKTVREMLGNPAYAGDVRLGHYRSGKFHQVGAGGEIVRGGAASYTHTDAIITRDSHEPIIGRDQFDRVQKRLVDMMGSKKRPKANDYFVTTIMRCGCCGRAMYGKIMHHKKRTNVLRYYVCSGGRLGECAHSINANYIEGAIIELIQGILVKAGNVDRLQAEIAAQHKASLAGRAQMPNGRALKAEIAKITSQIDKGVANLLSIDAEYIPAASRKLDELRAMRDSLAREIEAAESPAGTDTPEQMVKDAMAELMRLSEGLDGDDPMALREICRRLICSVTITSDVIQTKQQRRYRPRKAVVEFATHAPQLARLLSHKGGNVILNLHGAQNLRGVEWMREMRDLAVENPKLTIPIYAKATGLAKNTATMRLWRGVRAGLIVSPRRGQWVLSEGGADLVL